MRVVNLIPTYNEKENIALMLSALQKIAKKNKKYHFLHLVVDDNSPDHTAELVRKAQKKDKNIYLLTGPKIGLGAALIRGCQYAIQKLRADVVITNDCDFSFDPKHIPQMLSKITAGYDVVIGSRHIKGGSSQGWTLFRRLNHYIANYLLAYHLAGIKEVYDHNGNFRAIRVKGVLNKIKWDQIRAKGFGFLMYMSYLLTKQTKKICELPVIFAFREHGESKVSFNIKYIKTYCRDILEYLRLCLLIRKSRATT